jgi:two-component system response regulator NreC
MEQGIASRGATESAADERTVSVVLADDHQVVRDRLRLILDSELDIDVVAEARDSASAAEQVLSHRPSILLLDLNMPGGSSLELLSVIGEISLKTRTIIVTMQNEPDRARDALASGARGYVLKSAAGAELVEAIRTVLSGETFVSAGLGELA